jgi:hypothetical protein
VVVAAGLVGLAVVTLLVTFVLSMQNELTRREVLVLRTQLSAGEPPTGLALLNTHAGAGMTHRLADIFRDWETWAADVLHSHRANPILIQFRSADEAGEWLAVFGAVMDAAVLLLGAVEREGLEPVIAAARLFMAMGTRTLIELNALRRLDPVGDFADEQAMVRDIQRTRRRLAVAGYRIIPDEDGSVEEIADLLARYRPQLTALCRRLDVATARTLAEINEPRARFVIEPTSRR